MVITQTQPMSISFTLPEGDLLPVLTRYRQGDKLVVQIWDRGEKVMFGEGVLESIDNQIDATTGTLRLKARFDNEQELLIPNQFVNVRLRVETLRDGDHPDTTDVDQLHAAGRRSAAGADPLPPGRQARGAD
ncbi:hypothetical protein OSI62_26440, partial [Mycobacterium ulcerans]